MKRLIIFSILLLAINFCFSQDYEYQVQLINPKGQKILLNKLGQPFGSTLTIEGIVGATYRFRVYETGDFVGIPSNAYQEAKGFLIKCQRLD